MKNNRNNFLKHSLLIIAFLCLGFASANAITFSIGTDDYYVSVGDYDYLPYTYNQYGGGVPRVNFHDMMGDYGSWVNVPTFGQAWRPYASQGWRPYTQGRWLYTSQYGPMWQGYEPWAWAAYHYGNWIFTQQFGWVWLPGYEWHPGRVAWAQGYDSIGWTPMPPTGYDYSQGHLGYVGPNSQFSYHDQDFGSSYGPDFGYGGPYYDPRYRSSYYNPAYSQIGGQLWVFVDTSNFWRDNYADYYLGPEYAQDVFQRRLVRVTNQRLDRPVLERLTRQRVVETPVEVRELQTDKQRVRVVVPRNEESREIVRRQSTRVVREVIAPAFAEKNKAFKGDKAKNQEVIRKAFRQENAPRKVETVDSRVIVERAQRERQQHEQERQRRVQEAKQRIEKVEKEGKIKQPSRQPASAQRPGEGTEQRRVTPENQQQQQSERATPQNQRATPQSEELRRQQQQQQQRPDQKDNRPPYNPQNPQQRQVPPVRPTDDNREQQQQLDPDRDPDKRPEVNDPRLQQPPQSDERLEELEKNQPVDKETLEKQQKSKDDDNRKKKNKKKDKDKNNNSNQQTDEDDDNPDR